jgi:hypothetical protein
MDLSRGAASARSRSRRRRWFSGRRVVFAFFGARLPAVSGLAEAGTDALSVVFAPRFTVGSVSVDPCLGSSGALAAERASTVNLRGGFPGCRHRPNRSCFQPARMSSSSARQRRPFSRRCSMRIPSENVYAWAPTRWRSKAESEPNSRLQAVQIAQLIPLVRSRWGGSEKLWNIAGGSVSGRAGLVWLDPGRPVWWAGGLGGSSGGSF